MSLDDLGASAWADDTSTRRHTWDEERRKDTTEPRGDDGFGSFDAPGRRQDEDGGFGAFDAPPGETSPLALARPADDDDDDFGDFGEFEDVGGGEDGEESVWQDSARPPPTKSLALDPFPPPDLTDQLSALLSAIFPSRSDPALTSHLTREPIRQVDGPSQILYTESSRELYAQLVEPPPRLKPVDWKRSRVRREQLISLGIPVNLDEVDTTRLPPLKIVTKEGQARAAAAAAGRPPPRQGTRDEQKLGPPPEFDRERAERLLSYREEQLALVPPAYLTRMQQDLVHACSSASALVAHLKQVAEVRTDDNRQKNEQIAGLIAQAQRMKSGVETGGGGLFKRASVKRSSMTMSGVNTPRRSPALR
ncbi:hypothetical protein QFC20_000352 [Naganishia adeliensis]|uniref:Uncharacterized protein n=1 Tax=Naganishia adeliensis TaxID=92952 RepID=A0ACC2X0B9_9TREE|nr:hypothetical protein QFC20_000352 [Naganishia adeliensis]